MSDLVSVWCDLFVLGAIQNVPVLLCALLLDRLFARLAWPGPRRLVWALVVIELLLPVAFGSPVHVAGAEAVAVPIDGATTSNWPLWLFVSWAIGAGACLFVSVWSTRRLRRRLLRGSAPLPVRFDAVVRDAAARIGLRSAPVVRWSPVVSSPCVVGALRSTVLLDEATMMSVTGERLEHALLHEFGHLRRRDGLRACLVRAFVCLWWFHPTAWFAARRFALLREVGCDALVASVVDAPSAYCRTLATHAHDLAAPVAQPAFVRLPAEVLQRIAALRAAGRGSRALRLATALSATALLLLCCVPLREQLRALPFPIPSLDEPGCLLRRYLVLGQMADSSGAEISLTSTPTQQD